jgi:hypothetical protein
MALLTPIVLLAQICAYQTVQQSKSYSFVKASSIHQFEDGAPLTDGLFGRLNGHRLMDQEFHHQIAGMMARGNLSLGYSQWTNPVSVCSSEFLQRACHRASGSSIPAGLTPMDSI